MIQKWELKDTFEYIWILFNGEIVLGNKMHSKVIGSEFDLDSVASRATVVFAEWQSVWHLKVQFMGRSFIIIADDIRAPCNRKHFYNSNKSIK